MKDKLSSANNSMTGGSDAVPQSAGRRDFLSLTAIAMSAAGVALAAWPFIDSMEPASDTRAMGAPRDIDISKIQPGSQIIFRWRGKPMFIMRRNKEMLGTLKEKKVLNILRDPKSKARQQPPYATNWHRSIKPEFAVLVGVCTHLGCEPELKAKPNKFAPGWPGGYFCPCHGSKYDLAGRVFQGVPAPLNLPVPPYRFMDEKTVRFGENPKGAKDWKLSDIEIM